ncbi:MAG: hypothetical protein RRB22_12375 [Gammaproteobacteria bacterium]|nr:hypothetical protein [Gammaproteobacteria bacterium]
MKLKSPFILILAVTCLTSFSASAVPIQPTIKKGESYDGWTDLILFKWETIDSHDFHVFLEDSSRVHAYAWKVTDDPNQGLPYVTITKDLLGYTTDWTRSQNETFSAGLYVLDEYLDGKYTVNWYQTDNAGAKIAGTEGKYAVPEPGSLWLTALFLPLLYLSRRSTRTLPQPASFA